MRKELAYISGVTLMILGVVVAYLAIPFAIQDIFHDFLLSTLLRVILLIPVLGLLIGGVSLIIYGVKGREGLIKDLLKAGRTLGKADDVLSFRFKKEEITCESCRFFGSEDCQIKEKNPESKACFLYE